MGKHKLTCVNSQFLHWLKKSNSGAQRKLGATFTYLFFIVFLYKWFSHGLTKKTVVNSLHPSNREKDNTKITTKIKIEQK